MKPEPIEPQTVEPPCCGGLVEIWREAEDILLRGLEEVGLDDADARIDERRDAALLARRQSSKSIHGEIAEPIDADAVRDRRDKQENVHLLRIPVCREARKIGLRAFDPEGIRVGDEKGRVTQKRQCLSYAAAL